MGTLRAAKKRAVVDFEGQLLLQGVHDDVDVVLLSEAEKKEEEAEKEPADATAPAVAAPAAVAAAAAGPAVVAP